VKFFEPGALIPPLECFDAVSKGSIESCWTTPGYHTGKYPSLAFFTTVPFGPNIGEFLAWKWFGGGNKLREEIYAKHDLVAVDCFCIGRLSGTKGTVWQYTAIDVASAYTWATLQVTRRNPSATWTSDGPCAGRRPPSVSSQSSSHVHVRRRSSASGGPSPGSVYQP